ncbi:unnamed protein product, partial [Bubo scandiacus]
QAVPRPRVLKAWETVSVISVMTASFTVPRDRLVLPYTCFRTSSLAEDAVLDADPDQSHLISGSGAAFSL